jgi:hypothetical protein
VAAALQAAQVLVRPMEAAAHQLIRRMAQHPAAAGLVIFIPLAGSSPLSQAVVAQEVMPKAFLRQAY